MRYSTKPRERKFIKRYMEDSNVVMPMCNLIKYSKNHRKSTGSLWNYEPNNPLADNYNANPIANSL